VTRRKNIMKVLIVVGLLCNLLGPNDLAGLLTVFQGNLFSSHVSVEMAYSANFKYLTTKK